MSATKLAITYEFLRQKATHLLRHQLWLILNPHN